MALWDWDRVTRNDFMGAMTFKLSELMEEDTVKRGWFILLDQEQGSHFNFPSKMPTAAAPRRVHTTVCLQASRVRLWAVNHVLKLSIFNLLSFSAHYRRRQAGLGYERA